VANLKKQTKNPILITDYGWLRLCSHLVPSMVPKNDSRWALVWTHLFCKYSDQNSGTVSCPGTRSRPCPWVLNGTCILWVPNVWMQYYFVSVLRHQVWTQPKKKELTCSFPLVNELVKVLTARSIKTLETTVFNWIYSFIETLKLSTGRRRTLRWGKKNITSYFSTLGSGVWSSLYWMTASLHNVRRDGSVK